MVNKKQLGKNIKRLREDVFDDNQEQFAERINKGVDTIRKWEQGRSEISISNLIILRNTFNCTMGKLLENTNFFEEE